MAGVLTDSVAAEVRAEMARQRVTQRQLAEALGISQPQVSARLRGEVDFAVGELGVVAETLGRPVTQFLGRPGEASV